MADQTFYWGGRWWKPSDKAAFAKHLQAHGVSYAGWAKNHPALAARVFGSKTTAGAAPKGMSLADWAGKQYDDATAPELGTLETERARTRAESEQSMKNAQGIYAALAAMLGSAAPAVSSAYESAANTELAAGRGLGDQEAARGKAEGDKAEGYLTAAGAPQAAIEGVKAAAGGEGSGSLVYGLGGMLPATSTAREGAAFSSAAAMLPGTAVGRGQDELRTILSEQTKNDAEFGDKIAEIKAGRASGVQKIIQDFMENARAERALRLQEGYLGNTKRTTAAKITGVDPVTGQPTYEAVYDAAKVKADAAKARAAAKSKNQGAKSAAIKARESAFSTARHSMMTDAKTFAGHPMTLKEQAQWVVKHPGKTIRDAPKAGGGMSYAQAKQRLFTKYADLLRYATASTRPQLKRRLNAMIDQVLASYGIHPAAAPKHAGPSAPLGSGFTQLGKDQRG